MLIVSMRWFLEYWHGISAGAKYQIKLKANAFIMALPGKAKESDKQWGKQKKLKTAINKLLSFVYRKGTSNRAAEGKYRSTSRTSGSTS